MTDYKDQCCGGEAQDAQRIHNREAYCGLGGQGRRPWINFRAERGWKRRPGWARGLPGTRNSMSKGLEAENVWMPEKRQREWRTEKKRESHLSWAWKGRQVQIMLSIWNFCPRAIGSHWRLQEESDMFRITFSNNHFRYSMRTESGKEEMLGVQLRGYCFFQKGERDGLD